MRSAARLIAFVVSVVLAGCRDVSNLAPSTPRAPARSALVDADAGQYIVVFRDGVADPATLAQSLVSAQGGSLRHTYTSALKGFAASLPEAAVAGLRLDPLVAYVEPDHMVQVEGTEQMDARRSVGAGPDRSAGAPAFRHVQLHVNRSRRARLHHRHRHLDAPPRVRGSGGQRV